MSYSTSESSSSSFSSAGGSSIGSDNTDTKALTALQSGADGENADDLDSNNRSIQEGVFATIYTLTKNRQLDASARLAALKVVVEFLQLFRVLFNTSWPWSIQKDLWIFKAIQWLLFRHLLLPKGYNTYVSFFYVLAALILASIVATIWVALVLKGDDASNSWVKRLISVLQLFAVLIYTVFWVAVLDYAAFFFNCNWTNVGKGLVVNHAAFTNINCLATPHLAHMLFAGFLSVIFCFMTLVMSVGYADLNPMNRNWLASSDAAATFKILVLKMIIVVVGTAMDCVTRFQVIIVLLAVAAVLLYHVVELPYYNVYTNLAWTGLWTGLLSLTCILVNLEWTMNKHSSDPDYAANQTMVVLYIIFPSLLVGGLVLWARTLLLKRIYKRLYDAFEQRRELALASSSGADTKARAAGSSIVTLMGQLKGVYRFKDVRQVAMLCRDMRKWDEDGVPDPEAAEYGEFVLKSGMARMPSDPTLSVMYANFLIEVRKDGQAARTQLQLAQKANPTFLDNLNIYMAQQLAKQLKREGDGLDLMGYVEYQRNYRACVRMHKLALLAQRAFWNSLLRSDKISFKDMQRSLALMEETQMRATVTYRRVLERYPGNGRVLKVYGRFMEYVKHDPWSASKFYEEALKQGTTESLLNMVRGQSMGDLSAAGSINEKVDGLIIINAQGVILMLNAAAITMFGYEKGELEGKNVSVLMPQPFSTQHNSFLQRYVDSGEPHILDKTRTMVALRKDRVMFPVSLCATRLAGMGSDTLFMGVVRNAMPNTMEGRSLVRFWASGSGIIMCAELNAANSFGLDPAELVGQPFANLCTDVEAVKRFTAVAVQCSAEDNIAESRLKAQILHAYLPPVDVELSIELGGSIQKGSDCRTLIIQAQVLAEDVATLVLDRKGRVVYATDKLSLMLGYPTSTLATMTLNALLPQPYCQMHGAWFKDPDRKPHPTSCRSGGVVYLLAANGTKVPVTLKMSTKEAAGSAHLLHIVQVIKSSDSARLDQQRLLVSVNHKGTILETNSGVPVSLFGFEGSELIGRPLAAIVDIFGIWRHKFTEDSSLLAMLAFQAMEGNSNGTSACKTAGSSHISGLSWRVGVHKPVKSDNWITENAVQLQQDDFKSDMRVPAGGVSSLLHVLQQRNRLLPACMSVELMAHDSRIMEDLAIADTVPVLKVSLHRSDALTAILEIDEQLGIIKADESAGLMFGVNAKHLLKKSLTGLINWPMTTKFEDLLGTKGKPTVKKGAMKSTAGGAAGASRMGTAKRITTHHLGDGKPLTLEMQALSFDQSGKTHMLVRLQLQEATSSSLPALLQIKDGKDRVEAAAAATLLTVAEPAPEQDETDELHHAHSYNSSTSGNDDVQHERGSLLDRPQGNSESFNRTVDWVRGASTLPQSPRNQKYAPSDAPGKADSHPVSQQNDGRQLHQDDDEVIAQVSLKKNMGIWGKGTPKINKKASQHSFSDMGYSDEEEAMGVEKVGVGGFGAVGAPAAGSAAESGSFGGSASVGDGASEAGGGSMSSATDAAQEEDLSVDSRRAKRLKKLNRMLQSNITQAATLRWKRHTLVLLGVLLAAHVACFVVLTLQINSRYSNANAVALMARGLDRFQSIALRSVSIQKCLLEKYQNSSACGEDNLRRHFDKLQLNIQLASQYHKELYLGVDGLKPFADARLMDYWTYQMLPEYRYFSSYLMENGTVAERYIVQNARSLWEMGNVVIAAAKDIYLKAKSLGVALGDYFRFRYILLNGPDSIFFGYSWSLDIFVDYSWRDLLRLSTTLIVLLVVEAVVVQLSCMAYEFYLLQQCNVSHMRLFSVFLALPSATIKMVAQRQMQVDNDTKDDIENDDMDLLADGAPAAAGAATTATMSEQDTEPAPTEKKKSVRVMVDEESTDEEGDNHKHTSKTRSGKASAREKEPAASTKGKPSRKPALTGFARVQKVAFKYLFGWLDPKFKRNGKKLIADNQVVFKFMVPLLLWVGAVVIVFGVSYRNLQGLQEPLASLDTGAHVLYRLSRCRLMSTMLAFSESVEETLKYRALLKMELTEFKNDYKILLYGGRMNLRANVSFDPVAPASAFTDEAIANIFFKTTGCLLSDQSLCVTAPSDIYYDITHSGLDALINRYIDDMQAFSLLPDGLTNPNHPTYVFAVKVAGNDLYDGLQTACDLYVAGTISKFQGVKTLHIILLVISLACMLLFVLFLYRPYISLLHRDSKAVAGLLSQLPAEVDVEGIMKSIILGSSRVPAAVIGQSTVDMSGPAGFAGSMAAASMIGPNGGMIVPAGAMGLQALPMPGAAGAGYGYSNGPPVGNFGYYGQQPAPAPAGARGSQASGAANFKRMY